MATDFLSSQQNLVSRSDRPTTPEASALAGRLRAIVLLAGQVRSTELTRALKRSPLELPVDEHTRILDLWRRQTRHLAEAWNRSTLPLRVLVNDQTTLQGDDDAGLVPLSVENDAGEYRGAGGVARDLAVEYDRDDWIVLATAGQLLVDSLDQILNQLAQQEGDVRLISHADGTPTGIILARCGALWSVPEVGFIDLKEQVLPEIARQGRVAVSDYHEPVGIPVRTRQDYLRALYRYHQPELARQARENPFLETWQSTFSVVEPGATVDPTAHIHDSVVLNGAHVEAEAVVTQSVIADNAHVPRRARRSEAVVAPEGK